MRLTDLLSKPARKWKFIYQENNYYRIGDTAYYIVDFHVDDDGIPSLLILQDCESEREISIDWKNWQTFIPQFCGVAQFGNFILFENLWTEKWKIKKSYTGEISTPSKSEETDGTTAPLNQECLLETEQSTTSTVPVGQKKQRGRRSTF